MKTLLKGGTVVSAAASRAADVLIEALEEDALDQRSSHDFGKDIIPTLLGDEKRLFAYRFKGYWKDVGTIDSLWEANMDLSQPG